MEVKVKKEMSKNKEFYKKEINKLLNILKHYNPKKIILFGSVAKGRIHPESDIDLCILKDFRANRLDEKRKLSHLIWKYNYDYEVEPDIHLYKTRDYQRNLDRGHSFMEEINRGRIIY